MALVSMRELLDHAAANGYGIPAFSEAQRYSYGGDYLFPTLDWTSVLTVPALMVVICVLAAFGPAVMAARMRPADSLRYV